MEENPQDVDWRDIKAIVGVIVGLGIVALSIRCWQVFTFGH